MQAKRYNKGKNRLELLPVRPLNLIADVYTKGAHKYSVYKDKEGNEVLGKNIPLDKAPEYELVESGADNWRNGLSWTENIGSVKRHIAAFEECEDLDPELQTYHIANAAWGLITQLEQYRTHPELDDRQHRYLTLPKIGLDLDDCIVFWTKDWCEKHKLPQPKSWHFSYGNDERFKDPALAEWYKTLTPKIKPEDLPFEPHCYITARSIDVEITKQWLENNGFPTAPVYSVPFGTSKVEIAKQSGIDWFIDDSFQNFVELNKAGICTFLLSAPHNARYDIGYKRIENFKDFKERFL